MPQQPRTRPIQTAAVGYQSLPQSLREDETLFAALAERLGDESGTAVEGCSFRLVEVLLSELKRYIVDDLTQYLDDNDLEAGETNLDRTWTIIKALQQGKAVAPVVITLNDSGEVELLDGYHRVTAHHHAGRTATLAYELILPESD